MKNLLVTFSILFLSVSGYSQKIKLKEGKFKKVKGITKYNLVFDYSNLQIPKFDSEEAFLADKMKKREEKKPGSGAEFKKSWFNDRTERFEPKFIESFNKRFKNQSIKVGKNVKLAKHTIKIHTTKMYAGYNVGVWRHNAEISATITIYETANPSNVLLSGVIKKVQGKGAFGTDYDSGYRISECYAKLAKILAKYIKKAN